MSNFDMIYDRYYSILYTGTTNTGMLLFIKLL